ncbi:MAG: hypothetical protein QOI10_164 [Solirubrobacterales bacterium]|jgi:hypothetical protein|nr:hypothetical protein [Solirubrobacterales bacterium]
MNDLAQYSELRRPKRVVDEPEPFRFRTPIIFRLAPSVPLMSDRRDPHRTARRLSFG